MPKPILIVGASGQIGTELTEALREKHGNDCVIASDIRPNQNEMGNSGPFEMLDATDFHAVEDVVMHYEIETVYLMAAMLSATAEKFPEKAWNLNMASLLNSLNLAKEGKISRLFWPSSIAVFGPNTPLDHTPQTTIMDPTTVYGISKLAGERWCAYYAKKYGVDVRSVRYPGLISWKTQPGGGTTDYAVDIFHQALEKEHYTCFLKEDTLLPMMFMDDAIHATMNIMECADKNVKRGVSYNLSSLSFTPKQLTDSIRKYIPGLKVDYQPDFRQEIADSWPNTIDDSEAMADWDWKANYNLEETTKTMIRQLNAQYN